MEYAGGEQRKSERLNAAFTLTYNVDVPVALLIQSDLIGAMDALMLDLSAAGMAIITKHNLPKGAKIFIKFNIINLQLSGDDRRKHLEVAGEIVSNALRKDGGHRIGIRFDKISNADKQAIEAFVRSNKIST